MILVDSSVWIDHFRGVRQPTDVRFDKLLPTQPLVTGDLILTEVLQGFENPSDFRKALHLLTLLEIVRMGGESLAVKRSSSTWVFRLSCDAQQPSPLGGAVTIT